MDESEWTGLNELMQVLEPFAKATATMQSTQISLSDFFGFWIALKLDTKRHRNISLNNAIFDQMEMREVEMFQNPVFLSALFLDPRYQCVLTKKAKEDAIQFLVGLEKRIQSFKENDGENQMRESSRSDSLEDLASFLNTIANQNGYQTDENDGEEILLEASQSSSQIFREELNRFNGTKVQLTKHFSIYDWWKAKENAFPNLYHLAMIIHSIPPTQSTVERAFSSLGIILSSRRTTITGENLEAILLIRLNRKVYEELLS